MSLCEDASDVPAGRAPRATANCARPDYGIGGAELMRLPFRRELLRPLAVWAALLCVWLLLAGSVQLDELGVGAVSAAIAAFALDRAKGLARFAMLPRALAQVWRLPRDAVTGTWAVLAVQLRHLTGRQPAQSLLFAARYSANADSPAGATMRALAIAYTTVTPSNVVIDVDTKRGLILFHQLVESETPAVTRALGATG